jgi:hypothetical protein
MNVSPNELRKETVATLKAVELVITSVEDEAHIRNVPPQNLVDQNGSRVMAPLLLAKVQCLHTLTLLNEKR